MDKPRDPAVLRKRKIRRLALGTAGAAAVAAVSVAVANLEPAALAVEKESVWSETVQRGTFYRQVRGPGTLVPEKIQFISAASAGRVEAVRVEAGSAVSADSVLVELTNPEVEQSALDAELRLREAEAAQADLEARLASQILDQEARAFAAEADYQAARLQADADAQLNAEGLIPEINLKRSRLQESQLGKRSEIERQRVEKTAEQAAAQLASERARVEQLRTLYELRRRQLADLEVKAGLEGVLQVMDLEVGQRVAPGDVLARVAQPLPLKAELRIPETQAKDVVVGQEAVIDTRNGVVPGVVTRIDPAVQEGYVLVDVRPTAELPRGARPDLSVDGTIELERVEDVLHVGRPAYGQADSTIQLFKMIDGGEKAVRTDVQIGRTSVNTVEILAGLEEGDRVILSDPSDWDGHDVIRLR
jgi:HlyD family secretion protein